MQAVTEASADPPTIKNAGKLQPEGAASVLMALAFIGVASMMVGGMLLAVMTSHGEQRRGWMLHSALGAAGAALLAFSFSVDSYPTVPDIIGTAIGIGIVWAVIAGMALAVGVLARPPRKPKPPA